MAGVEALVREVSAGSTPVAVAPAAADGEARLVEDEERYTGGVGTAVYRAYAASLGGWWFALGFGFVSVALELLNTLSGAWLALWSSVADGDAVSPPPFARVIDPGPAYWVSIFLAVGVLSTLASLIRNFTWFSANLRASRSLHDRVVAALLRAPMAFWTATPSGRVLNRLSRDVTIVDQELPDYVSDVLMCFVEVVARLVTIAVASPMFLAVFVPVGAFYAWIARFYRASSRELKRLESIAASPLQARFADTVAGLVSLRAYGLQPAERAEMAAALDGSNTVVRASRFANRWMSLRIELSGAVIVAGVCGAAILTIIPAVEPYVPGFRPLLTLALTYAINLTGSLNWLVNCVSSAEAELTRVERLYHFASLDSEGELQGTGTIAVPEGGLAGVGAAAAAKHDAVGIDFDDADAGAGGGSDDAAVLLAPAAVMLARESSGATAASEKRLDEAARRLHGGGSQWEGTEERRRQARPPAELHRPPPGWPERGAVSIEGAWMRYRPDLEPVLRGISVRIPAGSSVGIVGRSGAGKSSLFSALFRCVELCRGRIVVDGIDTASLGVRDLRRRIAAVPQDPVMFAGPLRAALDPAGPEPATVRVPNKHKGAKVDEKDEDEDEDEASGGGHHGGDDEDEEEDAPPDCLSRCVCGDPTRPVVPSDTRRAVRFDPARGAPQAPRPTDEEMLAALDAVGLATWAADFTLDGIVEAGGANLSLGTRQLLSLARTLLRGCNVVALDEATASVSPAEDNAIQSALRTAFRGKTVLTIAHRLPTVIGYDRILVMDRGRAVEWGSPAQLLGIRGADDAPGAERSKRVTGVFASMVADTGSLSEAALRGAAARATGLAV